MRRAHEGVRKAAVVEQARMANGNAEKVRIVTGVRPPRSRAAGVVLGLLLVRVAFSFLSS